MKEKDLQQYKWIIESLRDELYEVEGSREIRGKDFLLPKQVERVCEVLAFVLAENSPF